MEENGWFTWGWTYLILLTVGKHEPDFSLSGRESVTAMHCILKVTCAEPRSQTDDDQQSKCCKMQAEKNGVKNEHNLNYEDKIKMRFR